MTVSSPQRPGKHGPSGPGAPPTSRGRIASVARRDQLIAVVAGIACMAAAQLLQMLVLQPRRSFIVQENESSIQSLIVTFPRLTLGGFRGILSTTLWIEAEQDKQDRKWFDLETKYDTIAALQPYFASVYWYHAWNQAYNLSAQWHDIDTKYKWVLDGLAYLYGGEKYLPHNPDLALEEANLYFLKLGGSFERIFFREHWRADIARLHELADAPDAKKIVSADALQHVKDFVTRPEFHCKLLPDPSGVSSKPGYGVSIIDPDLFVHRTDGKHANDPIEFRHGLSPYYFAYIAFNRTNSFGEPYMTGARVLSSEPGMSLMIWCRDDLSASAITMNALFNLQEPTLLAAPKFADAVGEVHDAYRNVQMIAPKAVDSLQGHLLRYPSDKSVHVKHILEAQFYQAAGVAESKLFDALLKWQNNGRKLDPAMKLEFAAILPDYDKAADAAEAWVNSAYPLREGQPVPPERSDLEIYHENVEVRKHGVEQFLQTDPDQKPDMSFLEGDVVER